MQIYIYVVYVCYICSNILVSLHNCDSLDTFSDVFSLDYLIDVIEA